MKKDVWFQLRETETLNFKNGFIKIVFQIQLPSIVALVVVVVPLDLLVLLRRGHQASHHPRVGRRHGAQRGGARGG